MILAAGAASVAVLAAEPQPATWRGITIAGELPIPAPDRRPDWTKGVDDLLGWGSPGCKWAYYSRERQPDCLAADLDRDHLMPQAEYLRSGGDMADYRDFYLDAGNIFVLPSAENRSKSDDVMSERWQPPVSARCRYVDDWLAAKRRWMLSADRGEIDALKNLSQNCPPAEVANNSTA